MKSSKRYVPIKQRFFPCLNACEKKEKRIWLHAVSLGETRAAFVIYAELKKKEPSAQFYLSYQTKTAEQEAAFLFPEATRFFLPLDLSWLMKQLIQKIQPDLFLLIEGDYWLNLLSLLKKRATPIVVVSADLSQRSYQRYKMVSFFSKKLFSYPDAFCLQGEMFIPRFEGLGVRPDKLFVCGNIKESFQAKEVEKVQQERIKERFSLDENDFLLVIGSTHFPEEKLLLDQLKPLLERFKDLRLLFVPRHPERFKDVEELLQQEIGDVDVYSHLKTLKKRVLLLDQTGMLCSCYHLSRLAVIGGSFVQGIGGHNILEPILRSCAVLFGPYMSDQQGFVHKVLATKTGIQLPIHDVQKEVEKLLSDPSKLHLLITEAEALCKQTALPLEKTVKVVFEEIEKGKAKHCFSPTLSCE